MEYTIHDFLKGKIAVTFNNENEIYNFLEELDHYEVRWYSGELASDFKKEIADILFSLCDAMQEICFYFDKIKRRLGWVTISYIQKLGIEYVNYRDLHLKKKKEEHLKVYIAGAITNNPKYQEEFQHAEKFLKSNGMIPFNQVKEKGFTYKEYIDMGLNELMHCDAIYLLKNAATSKGAMLELHYANVVGLKNICQKDMEEK